jgi:hypothetical protein
MPFMGGAKAPFPYSLVGALFWGIFGYELFLFSWIGKLLSLNDT